MDKQIKDTGSVIPRIKDTGTAIDRVDPSHLSEALGTKSTAKLAPSGGSPVARQALRVELGLRLKSTGGRPALEGATERQRIPLAQDDWRKLRELANDLSATPPPTASQVASVILHRALQSTDFGLVEASESERDSATGQWVQHVPISLHKQLIRIARNEAVTVNDLVTSIIAETIGKKALERSQESSPSHSSDIWSEGEAIGYKREFKKTEWLIYQAPAKSKQPAKENLKRSTAISFVSSRLPDRLSGILKED